jgi:hypothetical protein
VQTRTVVWESDSACSTNLDPQICVMCVHGESAFAKRTLLV